MTLFEIIITVLISLGIIIWGICVYFQKGNWLLAGWNTLSKEKKNTYNKKIYVNYMGNVLLFVE